MTDWKTTLTGLVTGVATILSHFGIILPESWQTLIVAIGVIVFSFVARDSKRTGE